MKLFLAARPVNGLWRTHPGNCFLMNTQNPQVRLLEMLQPLVAQTNRTATELKRPAHSAAIRDAALPKTLLPRPRPVPVESLFSHGIKELASPLAD